MKTYRITSGHFTLRPGTHARISAEQYALREHRVEVAERHSDGMVDIISSQELDFKEGETIGLECVEKIDAHILTLIMDDGKPDEMPRNQMPERMPIKGKKP